MSTSGYITAVHYNISAAVRAEKHDLIDNILITRVEKRESKVLVKIGNCRLLA